MATFRISHVTRYEYDRPVRESLNEIRIYPYPNDTQEVLQHDLIISTQPEVHVFTDYWGNKTGVFNVLTPHKILSIESRLLVRTTGSSQLTINFHSTFEQLDQETEHQLKLLELASPDTLDPTSSETIARIVQTLCVPDRSVASVVEGCSEHIFKNFKYIKGITDVETTTDEILEKGAGVCQDFAHLMLQILRNCRIPSRYVSGYICPNKNGMRGEGATHAWVEAWIPGYGWAGIDPTNNIWVTNKHVMLSVGRNFNDCSPVRGAFKGPARQTLSVYVSIGYEDGKVSEELNNIHLQSTSTEPPESILEGTFAGQQQ
jgi:transglutaminase-like putative cysteine protease